MTLLLNSAPSVADRTYLSRQSDLGYHFPPNKAEVEDVRGGGDIFARDSLISNHNVDFTFATNHLKATKTRKTPH